MKTPSNTIREHRLARGWSLQRLADACQTSKSQIDKLEKGERRLTVDWMVRLAKPLGCDPRDLLLATAARHSLHDTHPTSPAGAMPIKGLTRRGSTHDFMFLETPIDQTTRPAFLAHTQGAYAFYVPDDSMTPMYRPRQLLFINPHKPPTNGCGVVLVRTNGTVLLREYLGTNDHGAVKLREYRPKTREVTISADDIASIHIVAGLMEPL